MNTERQGVVHAQPVKMKATSDKRPQTSTALSHKESGCLGVPSSFQGKSLMPVVED